MASSPLKLQLQCDERGYSAPHRHPASGYVFAYVLSGTIRSQVEGEPVCVYSAGESWIEPPQRPPPRQRECEQDHAGAADRLHPRR
jgi:hypothetical protein